jgi:hypothetical protein
MVQQISVKLFSGNKYCTYGDIKSKKPHISRKVCFFKGGLRPLNQSRRVDIVNMNYQYTKESDGSTNSSKTLLRKKILHLRRF